MYYLKIYYTLNYIENIWYNRKSWITKNYKYNIKELKKDIYKILAQIKRSMILDDDKSYYKKINLYRKKI